MLSPVRLLAALTLVGAACASPKTTSGLIDAGAAAKSSGVQSPLPPLDPNMTVATINGTPVTGKDLDEAIHGELSQETDTYLEHVQKLREDGLDELIAEKLVDAEAKARGVTKEQLIQQEITSKVPQPSEEELKAFYERVVKPQYDVPYDAVKPQLVEQMTRAKSGERAKAFFDELRTKYKVKTTLPVRRVEVAATGPSRGPADAKVTIVEFSDFECPFCGRATPTIDALMKKYEGKIRLVFRQFPLPMHKLAEKAAEASLCANEQGKFWPMFDKLFANQSRLQPSDMKGYAKDLGLDTAKFDSCLDTGKMQSAVQADIDSGKAVGVNGTPAFFINGRPFSGALPQEKFESVIDAELNNG